MQVLVRLFCLLLVIALVQVNSQTNCNEIEFDAFSIAADGHPDFDLRQLLTPGTALDGVSFSNVVFPIVLFKAITNGLIDVLLILSPNQGFVPTIQNDGSVKNVNYTIIPDNITVSLNDGPAQTQIFNPLGNNFTFNNFLGNGATSVYNLLHVAINQNSTAPGATASCTSIYEFNITNPANSTIKGDPQFMGLRGQSYQVHGIDGAVYNLISDKKFQLNSRFVFLTGPRPCPVMPSTGRKSSACWAHAGSYLNELGLVVANTQVFIGAGSSANGFSTITVNDKPMRIGEVSQYVSYNSTHEATIFVNGWTIEIENSDMFVNLRSVRLDQASWSSIASHGLLGQTWSNKRYSGKVAAIEGEIDDYVIEENSVFGSLFVFNQYE